MSKIFDHVEKDHLHDQQMDEALFTETRLYTGPNGPWIIMGSWILLFTLIIMLAVV